MARTAVVCSMAFQQLHLHGDLDQKHTVLSDRSHARVESLQRLWNMKITGKCALVESSHSTLQLSYGTFCLIMHISTKPLTFRHPSTPHEKLQLGASVHPTIPGLYAMRSFFSIKQAALLRPIPLMMDGLTVTNRLRPFLSHTFVGLLSIRQQAVKRLLRLGLIYL